MVLKILEQFARIGVFWAAIAWAAVPTSHASDWGIGGHNFPTLDYPSVHCDPRIAISKGCPDPTIILPDELKDVIRMPKGGDVRFPFEFSIEGDFDPLCVLYDTCGKRPPPPPTPPEDPADIPCWLTPWYPGCSNAIEHIAPPVLGGGFPGPLGSGWSCQPVGVDAMYCVRMKVPCLQISDPACLPWKHPGLPRVEDWWAPSWKPEQHGLKDLAQSQG